MKKVTAKATWHQQETRPGQIGRIGNAVDEALKKAFEELDCGCWEVSCHGDLDSFGLHFTFTEKTNASKAVKPKTEDKPKKIESAKEQSFLKKAQVKWKSKDK